MCCNQQIKQVTPCGMLDDGQKINTGSTDSLITSHSPKPAKASTTCLQIAAQPLGGWRGTLCLMPAPGTPSQALKSKSCWDTAPLREASVDNATPERVVMGGGPAQTKPLYTVERNKVPVVHMGNVLRKTVWICPASSKDKLICGTGFAQGHRYSWWLTSRHQLCI